MFIVNDVLDDSSSVRSAMSTLRPYGTGNPVCIFNYKHFVPNGTDQKCS